MKRKLKRNIHRLTKKSVRLAVTIIQTNECYVRYCKSCPISYGNVGSCGMMELDLPSKERMEITVKKLRDRIKDSPYVLEALI